uniref:Cyclic nucleotide-binding domain-containing protein n=1 Tax=Ananas comosus var. bracteatus TaxID=296719 RepID=A0A6V7QDZ3_ANACO|nr:unnamed protein product [Ananas comosus var. bracteatus]
MRLNPYIHHHILHDPASPPSNTTTTAMATDNDDDDDDDKPTYSSYIDIYDDREAAADPPPDDNIASGGGVGPHYSWWADEWDRAFVIVCTLGLFIDPLFFYALSVSRAAMCVYVDGWFAVAVTVLRCMADAVHACNMWARKGKGKVVVRWPRRSSPRACKENTNYCFRSNKGFFFDLFVIFPLPQVVLWAVTPALIRRGSTTTVMTVFLVVFVFQYLPKIYHSVCVLRRLQSSAGCIFRTIWWGIALNLIAYFVGAHAVGACWYLLGIQRATRCLNEMCTEAKNCTLEIIGCAIPVYYGVATNSNSMRGDISEIVAWANNTKARNVCLDSQDNYAYGAYKWTVLLVSNSSRLEKMLLPIFWGLMNITTFGGGLVSTTELLEIIFNIIVVTTGLLLVTMLIGNIKVFLNSTTSKKQALHLKMRSMEWWMKRRKLPKETKQRVRLYERQRWAATRGVDECEMIRHMPEGLRRDIKYHLCLDLVRQVPLFQHMDELVLENICDRVKSLIFPKGETVTREGDPVQRMLFIVRGHLQSSQILRDGVKSCCMLGPGNFSGDELLSWCLRRPFVTLETTEAFSLEASDVKYVTQHFRYTFVTEKVRRSARYYSPGWRTWAAVAIQLAWRRYKQRASLASLSLVMRPRRPASSPGEDRLRHYAALLTSPKPIQDELS